jgi:hypothetical protein
LGLAYWRLGGPWWPLVALGRAYPSPFEKPGFFGVPPSAAGEYLLDIDVYMRREIGMKLSESLYAGLTLANPLSVMESYDPSSLHPLPRSFHVSLNNYATKYQRANERISIHFRFQSRSESILHDYRYTFIIQCFPKSCSLDNNNAMR